jgi:hypothetical protein
MAFVLYNHSTSYLTVGARNCGFRAFSRQAVQSGFSKPSRLPGLQRFRAFSRRIQSPRVQKDPEMIKNQRLCRATA